MGRQATNKQSYQVRVPLDILEATKEKTEGDNWEKLLQVLQERQELKHYEEQGMQDKVEEAKEHHFNLILEQAKHKLTKQAQMELEKKIEVLPNLPTIINIWNKAIAPYKDKINRSILREKLNRLMQQEGLENPDAYDLMEEAHELNEISPPEETIEE